MARKINFLMKAPPPPSATNNNPSSNSNTCAKNDTVASVAIITRHLHCKQGKKVVLYTFVRFNRRSRFTEPWGIQMHATAIQQHDPKLFLPAT